MPLNFARPEIPYDNVPLPNNERYQIIDASNMPLPSRTLDGEVNYIIDGMNLLDSAIASVQAGTIIGFDDSTNAGKLVTTNGIDTLFWTLVGTDQLINRNVTRIKIGLGAVGSSELDDGVVTNTKIGPKAVLGPNIGDSAISTRSYIAASIPELAFMANSFPAIAYKDHTISGIKLVAGDLITANYGERSITGPKVALTTINTENLVDGAATAAKVGVLATGNYGDATVTGPKIAAQTITKNNLAPSIQGIPIAGGVIYMNEAPLIRNGFGVVSFQRAGTVFTVTLSQPVVRTPSSPLVMCTISDFNIESPGNGLVHAYIDENDHTKLVMQIVRVTTNTSYFSFLLFGEYE